MQRWVDPVNNLVSADVDGNIAYRTVGRIPIRDRANALGPRAGGRGSARLERRGRATTTSRTCATPKRGSSSPRTSGSSGTSDPHPPRRRLRPPRPRSSAPPAARRAARTRRSTTWPPCTATGSLVGADVWVPPLCALDAGRRVGARRPGAARGLGPQSSTPTSAPAAIYVVVPRRGVSARSRTTRGSPRCVRRSRTSHSGRSSPSSYDSGPLSTGLLAADDTTLLPGSRRGPTCSPPRSPTRSGSCAPRSATTSARGSGGRCIAPRRAIRFATSTPSGPRSSTHPRWRWAASGTP